MHEKMRKLATLLMMVFALSAKAQQTPSYQHTIDLGVGLWISGPTVPGVIDHRSYDEKRHNGPIPSVTYQYMMNRHWGLGATASLLYYNKKKVYDDTGETIDKMSETALALMFTTRYYWRTKNWVRVYSSASVGLLLDWEKKYKTYNGKDSQKIFPSGQISPLGIEVGKYRLIGFGEIGLGMTGWFRAGIGYRF
jgi:hypothetical protein